MKARAVSSVSAGKQAWAQGARRQSKEGQEVGEGAAGPRPARTRPSEGVPGTPLLGKTSVSIRRGLWRPPVLGPCSRPHTRAGFLQRRPKAQYPPCREMPCPPLGTFEKVLTQGVKPFRPRGHLSPTLGMTDRVWPLPEAGVRRLAGARAEEVAGLRHTPTRISKSTRGGGGGSCKMLAAQDGRRITYPFSWRPRWSWFASRAWRSLGPEREHRIWESALVRGMAGVTHTGSPVSSVLGQPHGRLSPPVEPLREVPDEVRLYWAAGTSGPVLGLQQRGEPGSRPWCGGI